MTIQELPRCLQRLALVAVTGVAGLSFTGCQVDVAGQTLPSSYYLSDDVQYFPEGPEFKLAREAAAMRAAQQAQNEATQ